MNNSDKEIVFSVAEKLIGVSQQGQYRKDIIVRNVESRMESLKFTSFVEYLSYVQSDSAEFSKLVSSLTIHTTSWFREAPHFLLLKKNIIDRIHKFKDRKFKALSIACSTGEEVYTLGMVLEGIKQEHFGFDYEIIGIDIDPECIKTANNAVYSNSLLDDIPAEYSHLIVRGKDDREEFFTIKKDIKNRCFFNIESIINAKLYNSGETYDSIFCRNVLIYFSLASFDSIVCNISKMLRHDGIVTLGHSEALVNPAEYELKLVWNSSYRCLLSEDVIAKKERKGRSFSRPSTKPDDLDPVGYVKGSILVIDDSKTVRTVLSKLFRGYGYEVLIASSADEATKILKRNSVDLISLDIHMPKESGNVWLRKQRLVGLKTPVIIVTDASSHESADVLDALENGAQDYLKKSSLDKKTYEIREKISLLIKKNSRSVNRQSSLRKKKQHLYRPEIIMVGASTGGTEALTRLFSNFDKNCPPLIVVQHISPAFALPFTTRLCEISGLEMGECRNGVILKRGHIYMSRGDSHISVKRTAGIYRLFLSDDPPRSGHKPSVDFMFEVAAKGSIKAASILLTGMGRDGAAGLLSQKQKGAMTFVQDEESSVVFGMPGVAIRMGADGYVGNIPEIRTQLESCLKV